MFISVTFRILSFRTLPFIPQKICIEFSANYPLTSFRILHSAFCKMPLPTCIWFSSGRQVRYSWWNWWCRPLPPLGSVQRVWSRAGSVWIFQIRFDSVRFSISSTRVLVFFGFGICTPPQCRSIPVCENTKTESINFDKKLHLKHIDRPRWVCRSYSSHLLWSTPSHSAW